MRTIAEFHKQSPKQGIFIYLKKICALCFLLILNHSIFSQSYSFRNYTVNDGLPSSEIYHTIQDSKGYIWFATNNGVSRFNGYEFENFSMKDGLPDNTVFDLFEDRLGRIWFLPISLKLSYFYQDSIYQFEHNDSILKFVKNYSFIPQKKSFYVDSTNHIYFSSRRSGLLLKISEKGVIHNLIKDSLIGNGYITVEGHPILYVKGSRKYKIKYPTSYLLIDSISSQQTSGYVVGSMNEEELIVGINHFINTIKDRQITNKITIPEEVYWISQSRNRNYWIGTSDGFYTSKIINDKTFKRKHLDGHAISSINEDIESNIWITTLSSGVYLIPNQNIAIYDVTDSLLSNHTNLLFTRNNNLNFTYRSNGISSFNTAKNHITHIDKDISEIRTIYCPKNRSDIIICNQKGLLVKKEHKPTIELWIDKLPYTNTTSRAELSSAKAIYINNNDLWIGTYVGLLKKVKDGVHLYEPLVRTYDLEGNNEKLFIGGLNGLYLFDLSSEKYINPDQRVITERVNDIEHINDNLIALGTKGKGLAIYNVNKDTAHYISEDNGLVSNSINKLHVSDDSTIWVATNEGVSRVNLDIKNNFTVNSIQNLTIHSGLPTKEINDIHVMDSLVFMSSAYGLIKAKIYDLKPNTVPPAIHLESILNGMNLLAIDDDYEFSHYQNSLTIKYIGLSYKKAGNLNYKYRMTGLDESFVYTNERLIRYASLLPGKYTFEVYAQNEDGVWSTRPATISFKINRPFWKTWWFVLSTFIITGLIIYSFYRFRINEINTRNKMEKDLLRQVNKFRQQALSQQMNPHFIFNTLNSIQYFIFENDNTSSIKYLAKFSKLMRLILENSQHDTIPLQNELDAMDIYMELESLRLEKTIKYQIIIDERIDSHMYQISPLLIQPFIENAIWHGLVHKKEGEKRLNIEIAPKDDSIVCIVEDNGIGREQAMEIKKKNKPKHNSLGLEITKNRIETLNKLFNCKLTFEIVDLKDKEGHACGTRVLLEVPTIKH